MKGKEDALLFLIERNEGVYFVDIGTHYDIYDEIKLLEIIDNNWDFILNDKIKLVNGEKLLPKKIKILRNKNMNCCLNVNDKPIVGNVFFSASGIPINIVEFLDVYKTYLKNICFNILNDKNFLYSCQNGLNRKIGLNDLLFDRYDNTFKEQLIFNVRNSTNRIVVPLKYNSIY